MTGQSDGTMSAAMAALTDLVNTARIRESIAYNEDRPGWSQTWGALMLHLDAVRTTLAQEGKDYLPVAWAFVDSGRLTIARHMVRYERTRPGVKG